MGACYGIADNVAGLFPQRRHPPSSQIYVDVYLGADARRADPLPGYESFFQEKLMAWSELNAAEHFVGCFNRLRSLSSGMAQLVHHAGKIVDIILDRVHPAASAWEMGQELYVCGGGVGVGIIRPLLMATSSARVI